MCFDPVLCDLRLDVKGMSSWGVVAVSIYIYTRYTLFVCFEGLGFQS